MNFTCSKCGDPFVVRRGPRGPATLCCRACRRQATRRRVQKCRDRARARKNAVQTMENPLIGQTEEKVHKTEIIDEMGTTAPPVVSSMAAGVESPSQPAAPAVETTTSSTSFYDLLKSQLKDQAADYKKHLETAVQK